jgi:hypothetical protein
MSTSGKQGLAHHLPDLVAAIPFGQDIDAHLAPDGGAPWLPVA